MDGRISKVSYEEARILKSLLASRFSHFCVSLITLMANTLYNYIVSNKIRQNIIGQKVHRTYEV